MKGLTILGIFLLILHQSSASRLFTALRKGLLPLQFTQYEPGPGNIPVLNVPSKMTLLRKPLLPPVKQPPPGPPQKTVKQLYQCLRSMLRPQLYHQLVVVPQLKRFFRTIQLPSNTYQMKRPLPICPYC